MAKKETNIEVDNIKAYINFNFEGLAKVDSVKAGKDGSATLDIEFTPKFFKYYKQIKGNLETPTNEQIEKFFLEILEKVLDDQQDTLDNLRKQKTKNTKPRRKS